ncbi:MAG TPA: hypothetical protein DD379_26600 [Cyanobacteria bacterium UBA11162]|nr:hypothetical protein [Cyanobacteria bacterium UBA11162]
MVEWLVKELKLPTNAIDTTKSFADYGLDSVTAVELADALQDWLGVTLSPTLAYDYPTIESMAQYLAKESTLQNSKGANPHYTNPIQNSQLKDTADKTSIDFSLSSETETPPSSGDEEVDQLLSELETFSEEEQANILGKL